MTIYFRKIPIKFSFFFWITMWVFSFLMWESLSEGFLAFCGLVISLLVHELGHALMAQRFGFSPVIEMTAFGGRTFYLNRFKISLKKEIAVVISGPISGIILFIISSFLMKTFKLPLGLDFFLSILTMVNLYWTLFNLLPFSSLDGGKLLSLICQLIFRHRGIKIASLISLICSGALGVYCFMTNDILLAILVSLFFATSIREFLGQKKLSKNDVNPIYQKLFEHGVLLKEKGDDEGARFVFQQLLASNQEGFLALVTSVELARLSLKARDLEEAFHYLLPFKDELTGLHLYLLHQISYDLGRYDIVRDIGQKSYQENLDARAAFMNSVAFAQIQQTEAALGWLECSLRSNYKLSSQEWQSPSFEYLKTNSQFMFLLNQYCK